MVCLLVTHCRERPEASVEILFELLAVFLAPNLTDYSFLKVLIRAFGPERRFRARELHFALETQSESNQNGRASLFCAPFFFLYALSLISLALRAPVPPQDFLRDEVAAKFPAPVKRAVVLRFLAMLKDDAVDAALKVLSLQLLVIPLLSGTFCEPQRHDAAAHGGVVVDGSVVKQLMADALDTAALPRYPEGLRVELLRLATLLIEHLGRELVEHRKELIKFAWNHLKSDDSTSKMWAYVNVCRFIAVYETPPKIILQVYVALLRAYQPESKDLVQTALDILVPALPRRLPAPEFVKAIKWTKKIMFEEGHALPMLVHIFGLLVRHPALFYSYRAQFVPQMVQFFNRLGRFPNAALDHRKLAAALVHLILAWEGHRRERLRSGAATTPDDGAASGGSAPGGEDAAAVAAAVGSAVGSAEDDFTLPVGMIDMVVNFLTRLALFTADHKVRDRTQRALGSS